MRAVGLEQAGDPVGAEQSLRQATLVSDYFIPWWSLAAFYYRQQDATKFLQAAHHALSLGTGDTQSILQMAENLKIPPASVEQQLVPDLPLPLEAWLDHSLKQGNLDTALSAALRLTHVGSGANRSRLLTACEELFLAGRPESAVMLWNRISEKHWMQMTPLDPSAGVSLNDGELRYPRLLAGFDWKLPAPNTVEITPLSQGGIRFVFDGHQPENCDVLSQYLPLLPGRKYQLKTRFRTRGIPPDSGLAWVISVGHKPFVNFPSLASDDGDEQIMAFESPRMPAPVQLVLSYSRRTGTTRIEGELRIESVSLNLLPGSQVE
jgi:hypothetical protein